ncbi:thiamine-phosphate kinase [uncultured Megasphaera sp.]|uniref:thiamine-phosphate kinase n=1 Tax=uncultured Megasphaera sp. TaxID=165188 RepID=UPI0025984B68|nr:thiamine-phosphate kinase [uncultured Megasphaera sp.]
MNISDIGEFGFIRAIQDHTIVTPETVTVGIGDDGAVYKTTPGMEQVVVIDTMIEGNHFIIGKTATWHAVGYKAVASNLSDIAAMGATATQLVLSTALIPSMTVADVKELYRGMKDICQVYGVNMVGGDTVTARESTVITVTVLGEIEKDKALLRSGANVGDVVAISHTLGNSCAGLDVLLQQERGYEELVKHHQYPQPQLALGRLLVSMNCHCANDISDGLASEANEIAKASGVNLILDKDKIPFSPALEQWCAYAKKDRYRYAFGGGEDYELVFTMAEDDFYRLKKQYDDVTIIGSVQPGTGMVLLRDGDKESPLQPQGWTHF